MSARAHLAAVAALALSTGCDQNKDCGQLINAMEASLAERRDEGREVTVATLRARSAAYARLAADLAQVAPGDTKLKAIAERYRSAAADLATGFQMLAGALEEKDENQLRRAEDKLDDAGWKEHEALQEFGERCAPPPAPPRGARGAR
ncbi:hypothetical protein [Sorangium sp. So ce861]|uniref:hypothetical protein n=1 Tax=Sorangium sp. So ce861 TaxID=3133323 RepID=UPI003F5E104C